MRKLTLKSVCSLLFFIAINFGTYRIAISQIRNNQPAASLKIHLDINDLEVNDQKKILNLVIKNEAKVTIVLIVSDPFRDFDITIENENSLNVALTKAGEKLKLPPTLIHNEIIYLKPGEEFKSTITDFDKLFNFNKSGKYTIKVKRTYGLQEFPNKNYFVNKTLIYSQKVSI